MRMENKKIKIGINASFARKPNTGIGQVTLNFLRKLSELKVQSDQPTGEARKFKVREYKFIIYLEEELSKNIKLPKDFEKQIFLPLWKRDDLIRKIWWEKYLLPKEVKKDKCDVLISLYQCSSVIARKHNNCGSLMQKTMGLLHFARNDNNIKHLMVVHDIIPELFPEYLNNSRKKHYWEQTKRGIKKADRIIAISKRTEKDLIQHLGISPMKITASYIDVDEIYKKEVADEKNKKLLRKYRIKPEYILAGGGYEFRKNVESVIRAYKLLLDSNKSQHFILEIPKLVIYGKLLPELAPLATDAEKLVKELNLTKQVKLLDLVSQENMPALYKNAVMFIYPSHYEGFGMPVLEAMNVGIPIITSKNSSLPEVGGDAVLYCNPDDIHDIAMVMKNVMLNKDLRDVLSYRAKEKARQFSWDKFTEKVLNIVKNL
jgi:glycosyltransferase involved in cell wall biosynthesis